MVDLFRWLEHSRGARELLRIYDLTPAPWKCQLDPTRAVLGIRVGGWYPAGLVHAVYDAMAFGLPHAQSMNLARIAGVAVGERMLSGIFRQLFSAFVSPQRFIANMPRMWRETWTDGQVSTKMLGPTHVEGTISDWGGHHTFGCELLHACVFTLFGKLRIVGVRFDRQCKGNGDVDACSFHIDWTRGAASSTPGPNPP